MLIIKDPILLVLALALTLTIIPSPSDNGSSNDSCSDSGTKGVTDFSINITIVTKKKHFTLCDKLHESIRCTKPYVWL